MKSNATNLNVASVAALIAAIFFGGSTVNLFAQAEQTSLSGSNAKKPNILVIWGDDIGIATAMA